MEPTPLLPYDQARLLDTLLAHFKLKRDSELAEKLSMSRPFISKLRHGQLPIGAAILIRIHEASDLSISELRHILGDRRKRFRGRYSLYNEDERAQYKLEKAA